MRNRVQPNGTGYTADEVTKAVPWHDLVVADALFNGLATGLFLVAGLGALAAPHLLEPPARWAFPLALLLLLTDLTLLVLDLGDPLRFHHMLRVFKPSSPMSFGVWALSAFAGALTVVVALDLLGGTGPVVGWLKWLAVLATLPLALASATYKGVLFSTSSQPGWRDARWLGGYFTASDLALGTAQLLLLALLTGPEGGRALLRLSLVLVLAISAVLEVLLLLDLRPALNGDQGRRHLLMTGGISLAGGVALPILLVLTLPGFVGEPIAAGLVLLDGMLFRRFLIQLPHHVREYRGESGMIPSPPV